MYGTGEEYSSLNATFLRHIPFNATSVLARTLFDAAYFSLSMPFGVPYDIGTSRSSMFSNLS